MLWTHFKGQQSYENNTDVVKMRTMAGGGGAKLRLEGDGFGITEFSQHFNYAA